MTKFHHVVRFTTPGCGLLDVTALSYCSMIGPVSPGIPLKMANAGISKADTELLMPGLLMPDAGRC
jgi:hypothetical protein